MLLITRNAKPEEILAVPESEAPTKLARMWAIMGERLKSTAAPVGA